MNPLLKHIRKIIYIINAAIGIGIYFYVIRSIPSPTLRDIRMTELFGFASIILLYLALLASPLYKAFPRLPSRALHIKARPALGVSAFFFALAHSLVAFFSLLGGFPGLGFLSGRYILDLTMAATALLVLGAMALTSNDYSRRLLGRVWKRIHRFVYFAGLLIIIHTLVLGSHFTDLSRAIPQIFLYALLLLLALEALRLDKFWQKRFSTQAQFGPVFILSIFLLTLLSTIFIIPHGAAPTLGIHSQHLQQLQNAATSGNSTVRYTVSMSAPEQIAPNKDVALSFKIFNADTGAQETQFNPVFTKLMHLVIVNNELDYYSHIHPELSNGAFAITTQFPKADLYHLYLNFQPDDGQEQQFALTLPVGNFVPTAATQTPDTNLTKTFGGYTVTLTNNGSFSAKDLSAGQQAMAFHITDATTGAPIKTLKPYLGSFGHLVMINEQSYEYVHIHPSITAISDNSVAGPDISFIPFALFGPLKAGTYRVFLQINPAGRLTLADFTIAVK
jgi:DMSO/TMAO reductase YedYZ heme-binding membrane subunit